MIAEHRPTCLVIDPLSALSSSSILGASPNSTKTFLDSLKVGGITVVNTSVIDDPDLGEATGTGNSTIADTWISTMADTWIHLYYLVNDGERRRMLTIVKSRGAAHSNDVRKLIVSNAGVALADVS